ncbi:MAG TPA: response regulator [Anaerolineae bacterium]|nr:response regulator [Anaerolineae bacterium]HQH37102.1 response regulator [Anaerolineae bacterium]
MSSEHILVVDDDPAVVMTLAASLERLSEAYVIETCLHALEALHKIEQQPYNLLITDYRMPGMNGLELVKAVRHIVPTMPVIMMTAYGTGDLRQEADKLGHITFVDKPFTVKQIRDIVSRLMNTDAASSRALIVADKGDLHCLAAPSREEKPSS